MSVNVYNIPPGAPFLETLGAAILNGDLPREGGPRPSTLDLPKVTLLLPTRRAARAAQDAFLSAAGARALLMPVIRPISEADEDAGLISTPASADAFDAAPAVTPMQRVLTLMRLVQRWRQAIAADADRYGPADRSTPAQSANLAFELAKLMDDVEREGATLDPLERIVPEGFAEHWRQTVDFLKIVTSAWPAHLAENGLTSPQARVNSLIRAEADRIARLDADDVLIVAGVTGSIPATVALMQAVAARRNGAIVLPALDEHLDERSWRAITPEHPQFGLKSLLDRLGVERRDVRRLTGAATAAEFDARGEIVAEALRPSSTTAGWRAYADRADRDVVRRALAGVALLEAPTANDEAEAVALILREAVETPGRTAALVSPDRILARRVAVRLASWGIRVDDSAGRPLTKTPPGAFLTLVIDAMRSDFDPTATMALLKHPLCRLRLKPFDVRRFGRALEISAFRAPYFGRGMVGIVAALEKSESDRSLRKRQTDAADRLWDEDRVGALDLAARLGQAFAPLAALYDQPQSAGLKAFVAAHVATAEALAAVGDDATAEASSNPLWHGVAGEAANGVLREILDDATPDVDITSADYADLFTSLIARQNVREHAVAHPRVSIWGPMEARLQRPDVIVLGSLNDGVWPEAAEPGPWLNRPMRADLGLPSPEEQVGRSAHDFTSLLGAEQVVLTRSQKDGGVPTVPSRWIMRLTALLGGMGLGDALIPPRPWLGWVRARDAIDERRRMRITAPEPKPPVEWRPRRLSVTAIETWVKNPYAIFAQRVLRLSPLPELGAPPDASLRGALVHEALSRFAIAFPDELPPDHAQQLNRCARDVLEQHTGHPRIAAFWMPRLERFMIWFAETEPARRTSVARVLAETSGSLALNAPFAPFTITARADRIDVAAGGLVITDYKTGRLPSDAEVTEGRSPQLALEAAIAEQGAGFEGAASSRVAALRYIRASGGEPPGEEREVGDGEVSSIATSALAGLTELIARFDDPATPYRAVRRPKFNYEFDAYALLARVAEWSAHIDDETAS